MVIGVMVNDLRKSLFRRKPVLAVALMALAILVLIFGVAVFVPFNLYGGYHTPLWSFLDVVLPIIAPAFAAGSFAKEHEQRTWQDVLLTRLSAREILFGKLFACLVPTCVAATVLFPPFSLLLITQNVRWAFQPGPWMFILALKFLLTTLFYLAFTMVCSYYSANMRTALVVSYVLLFVYSLVNYGIWTYIITPYFLLPEWLRNNMDYTSAYGSYSGYYSSGWSSVNASAFQLNPAEWLRLIQTAVLAIGMLVFLRTRLRLSRRT